MSLLPFFNFNFKYTGNVEFLPPAILISTCEISITDFPWDEQICQLQFGTWTYDVTKVNLRESNKTAQLDTFITNGEWDLLSNT
jgi:nicotinic acetylcholine receptor